MDPRRLFEHRIRHEREHDGSAVAGPRIGQERRARPRGLVRELPHERDALVRQAANRSPATARERSTRRVPQPAARGLDAQSSEVATDPRLEASPTDMQAPRPADLVERQEFHDALCDVARADGGADCDRCWGVHFFCVGTEPYRQVTLAHDSFETTDGPQRAPDPSTSAFVIVCFSCSARACL